MKLLTPPMNGIVNVAIVCAVLAFVYVRTHALALIIAGAVCYLAAALIHLTAPKVVARFVERCAGFYVGVILTAALFGTADVRTLLSISLVEFFGWFICRFVIIKERPGIVL